VLASPAPTGNRIDIAARLARAVRLVWRASPRWTVVNAALVCVQGALPLAALYLMKRIVDAVTAGMGAPDKALAFQHVALWILCAGGVAILAALMRALGEYASEAQSLQVTDAVTDILHTQSIAVDVDYYEDPSYYNTLHRAQREAPYRPTRVVNGLIQIGQNGISLLGIAGLLFSFNWVLALVLFLAALPGVLTRWRHSRRLDGFEQAHTEQERRAGYYHSILSDAGHAKELRLFNLGAVIQTRYRALRQCIRSGRLTLTGRRVLADTLAYTLAIAALFGSLAWIAHQALLGAITIGGLLVCYLGFQSGLNFLQAVLRAMAALYEDSLFLTNVYRFLDLSPKIVAPHQPIAVPHPMVRGLTVHRLGFTYPSRDQETLHDIDLTLRPGEVIALVGENGSGKTTLIKLLCRLYDPTRGGITVDGIDLRAMDPVRWRREISVVLQDYAHYDLTAAENIWLGDVERLPDPVRLEEAGRRSGADAAIRRLPQAYETMLGHRFTGGQELSVGEWQKIALARAFWRNARIIVMDEPTSSLDPLAEEELFRQFRALLEGRSAVLVSHRFSTVQMADCIYVMEQGSIVERGTHQALLAQNGRYARLYRAQAQHYQERPSGTLASRKAGDAP
jgi:ATP-binding cassette subfamily B protein